MYIAKYMYTYMQKIKHSTNAHILSCIPISMHTYWNTRTYTEAPSTLRYLDHHSCSAQQQGVQSSTVALVSQKLPDCFLHRSSNKSEPSPTAHVFPGVHSGQHSEL